MIWYLHNNVTSNDILRADHMQEEQEKQEELTLLIGDSMKKSLSLRAIEEASRMTVVAKSAHCSVPDWEGALFLESNHKENLRKELSKVRRAEDIYIFVNILSLNHNQYWPQASIAGTFQASCHVEPAQRYNKPEEHA